MSKQLVVAVDRQRQAAKTVLEILMRDYPVGTPVSWLRGSVCHGKVLQQERGRLLVQNLSTLRTGWIEPDEIVAAVRGM